MNYRFNRISIKIPKIFLAEIKKKCILIFLWTLKEPK